jgi:hypothetical protein
MSENHLETCLYHLVGITEPVFKRLSAIYDTPCITEKYPTALYVHCVPHSLNSAEVSSIRNCFGVTEKMYTFFNAPKRQLVLLECSLHPKQKKTTLKALCATRWVQRHDAVLIIMTELYHSVVAALEKIKLWDDKESSSGAFILQNAALQSDYIISLLCAEKLLAYSLPLCKTLQSADSDLASAVNNAENTVSVVKRIRENAEQEFRNIFKSAENLAETSGAIIQMPRLTGKQTHRCNISANDPEEYYRCSVFIPWVDSFINNVSERFIKHKQILKSFVCLLPSGTVLSNKQKEDLLQLTKFYVKDLNQISGTSVGHTAELELWYEQFNKNNTTNTKILPKNTIEALNLCNEDIYPITFTLLKIFATLPVSTSTAERSFSTLRRIKTYLKNTMDENKLNGLANLNIHREIPVQYSEVLSILKEKGHRRLNFVL